MRRFARRQRRAVITIAPDGRRIDSSEVLNCSPRSRALRHIEQSLRQVKPRVVAPPG